MFLATLSLFAILSLSNAATLLRDFDPRIVNGVDAKLGEIPYQVSLQLKRSSFHFCGGSVLNQNYVITASHCVSGKLASEIKVIAGTINLKAKPEYESNVVKIIMHEKYNASNSWINDIALLKLQTPVKKTSKITFVPLPPQNQAVKANDNATVSGWGRLRENGPTTDRLQRADIMIADQGYCRKMYNDRYYNIYSTQVCAYDPTMQKGSCNGDSGGPLTVNGKLTGLVSWAMGCARTDYPTVYTRVASYLDWIKTNAV